jgi:hypothetical protein
MHDYIALKTIKENNKEHNELFTQFGETASTLRDINPGKEHHYGELIFSLTTHNKTHCCICLFLILVHLLPKGLLPLNTRHLPLSPNH